MSDESSVSKAASYKEIGAFWDSHDATEVGGQDDVEFDVVVDSQQRYLALDEGLSRQVRHLATRRGIGEASLVQQWIREKLEQELAQDGHR